MFDSSFKEPGGVWGKERKWNCETCHRDIEIIEGAKLRCDQPCSIQECYCHGNTESLELLDRWGTEFTGTTSRRQNSMAALRDTFHPWLSFLLPHELSGPHVCAGHCRLISHRGLFWFSANQSLFPCADPHPVQMALRHLCHLKWLQAGHKDSLQWWITPTSAHCLSLKQVR